MEGGSRHHSYNWAKVRYSCCSIRIGRCAYWNRNFLPNSIGARRSYHSTTLEEYLRIGMKRSCNQTATRQRHDLYLPISFELIMRFFVPEWIADRIGKYDREPPFVAWLSCNWLDVNSSPDWDIASLGWSFRCRGGPLSILNIKMYVTTWMQI